MGRSPCCEKVGLKKGPWTAEEDQKLLAYIEEHGHGSWRALPIKAGLLRCGKSCRLRWTNYLRPDIKRGKFSLQEEQTIIQLHALLGNRWSAIATHLPKRTDNEIKNYWNTHLKKRLAKMGIDPITHKPKSDALASSTDHEGHSNGKAAANLSHMAQWESARLEAEARLVHESKLQVSSTTNLNNEQLPAAVQATSSSSSTAPALCLDVIKAWQATWSTRAGSTAGSAKIMPDLASLALDSPTSTLSFSPCNNGSSTAADHNNNITSNSNGCKIAGLASTSFSLEDSNINSDEFIIDNPQKLGFLSFLNQLPIRRQSQDDEFTCDHEQEHQPSMTSSVEKTKSDEHGINGDSASAVFGNFHDIFSADQVENDNSCEITLQSHASVIKEAVLPKNYLDNVDGGTENSVINQCDNDDEPTDLDSEEENRSYWNSILNMVNSSSSPERSPMF